MDTDQAEEEQVEEEEEGLEEGGGSWEPPPVHHIRPHVWWRYGKAEAEGHHVCRRCGKSTKSASNKKQMLKSACVEPIRRRLGRKWGAEAGGQTQEDRHTVAWMIKEGGWPAVPGDADELAEATAEAERLETVRLQGRKRKAEEEDGQGKRSSPRQKRETKERMGNGGGGAAQEQVEKGTKGEQKGKRGDAAPCGASAELRAYSGEPTGKGEERGTEAGPTQHGKAGRKELLRRLEMAVQEGRTKRGFDAEDMETGGPALGDKEAAGTVGRGVGELGWEAWVAKRARVGGRRPEEALGGRRECRPLRYAEEGARESESEVACRRMVEAAREVQAKDRGGGGTLGLGAKRTGSALAGLPPSRRQRNKNEAVEEKGVHRCSDVARAAGGPENRSAEEGQACPGAVPRCDLRMDEGGSAGTKGDQEDKAADDGQEAAGYGEEADDETAGPQLGGGGHISYGKGHRVAQTGTVAWCVRCGAHAESRIGAAMARECTPIVENEKSGRAYRRSLLLRGLHPITRQRLA